jgi:hypothetical protein
MDLPVVHCLDMLLRKLNPETARLTKGQKHCISEFLSIVLRHPDFYFCVEVRDELKRAAVAWRSSAEENRVRRAEPPPPPEQ